MEGERSFGGIVFPQNDRFPAALPWTKTRVTSAPPEAEAERPRAGFPILYRYISNVLLHVL